VYYVEKELQGGKKKKNTKKSAKKCNVAHDTSSSGESSSYKAEAFSLERSQMIHKNITIIGTLTFYVNPSNKIYRMAFMHCIE